MPTILHNIKIGFKVIIKTFIFIAEFLQHLKGSTFCTLYYEQYNNIVITN